MPFPQTVPVAPRELGLDRVCKQHGHGRGGSQCVDDLALVGRGFGTQHTVDLGGDCGGYFEHRSGPCKRVQSSLRRPSPRAKKRGQEDNAPGLLIDRRVVPLQTSGDLGKPLAPDGVAGGGLRSESVDQPKEADQLQAAVRKGGFEDAEKLMAGAFSWTAPYERRGALKASERCRIWLEACNLGDEPRSSENADRISEDVLNRYGPEGPCLDVSTTSDTIHERTGREAPGKSVDGKVAPEEIGRQTPAVERPDLDLRLFRDDPRNPVAGCTEIEQSTVKPVSDPPCDVVECCCSGSQNEVEIVAVPSEKTIADPTANDPDRIRTDGGQQPAELIVGCDGDGPVEVARHQGSSGHRGAVTVKVVPTPTSLVTAMEPPWSWINRLQMGRPSPAPRERPLGGRAAWVNSSKTDSS